MEKKRKLPARAAARVDAVSKKRTSTPPEQPTPPPAAPPEPAQVVEEPLPRSIVAGKPLPTVDRPQSNLHPAEYQSIPESGVMAESLERSRKKWLIEGIFERYWTKPPSKKKNVPLEELNNPPKDSMTKIGTCTITIEPHSFDAIMYTIKDPNSRSTFQPPPQPMYRPIMQYGPPNGMMPPPPPSPAPQQQPVQTQPSTTAAPPPPTYDSQRIPNGAPTQPGIPPNVDGSAPYRNTPPSPAVAPNPPVMPTVPNSNVTHSTPTLPQAAQQSPPVAVSQTTSSPSPAPAPTKSSDPVIQMLAERAATDQNLKALMRVVADGKAATRELKRFQAHIDELTKLLHARQASAAAAASAAAPPPTPPPHPPAPPAPAISPALPAPPAQPQNISLPPSHAQQSPATTPQRPPQSHQSPHMHNHHTHTPPQPQALRSKGPPPAPKPDISGVAFEFVGGSGDRFLFPKYSVLEYMGGFVIASFLIVRKGSSADAKSYDPQLDYYQPVTIRIYANQTRLLDTLAKVVAHPEEVRRYMDDIMDNMTRAEYVLLAMQLPRDGERPARQSEDVTIKDASPENQVMWMASANGDAIKQKPIKKSLSEEEHYRSFISTIS